MNRSWLLCLLLSLNGYKSAAWTAPSVSLTRRSIRPEQKSYSTYRNDGLLFRKKNRITTAALCNESGLTKETPPEKRAPLRKFHIIASAIGLGLVVAALLSPRAVAAATAAASPAVIQQTAPAAAAVASEAMEAAITTPLVVGAMGANGVLPRSTEIMLSFRLLYASLVGSVVGWERSASNHSAGIRTMSLVSLGAAAFTICSSFGFTGFKYDPSRMASNVASGVGFIGAGVITTHNLKMRNYHATPHSVVHGLTTAAAIWISAAVGVASGVGMYFIAGTAALATVSILRFGKGKPNDGGGVSTGKSYTLESSFTSEQQQQQHSRSLVQEDTHDLSTWDEEEHMKTRMLFGDGMAQTSRRFDDADREPQHSDPHVQDFQTVVENQTSYLLPSQSNMTDTLWSDENVVQVKHIRHKDEHEDMLENEEEEEEEEAASSLMNPYLEQLELTQEKFKRVTNNTSFVTQDEVKQTTPQE